jgi:epoxyqueuosine reductase
MDLLKEKIKAKAQGLGFTFIGFSEPKQSPHFNNYQTWLKEPHPDELDYLGKKYVVDARKKPAVLLQNAKSVISLGFDYPNQEGSESFDSSENKYFGQIASYACLPDYHRYLKEKSNELTQFIKSETGCSLKNRFFVDSGPVMEKDFAFQSGLGWIGKNSLFISPIFGSFCLLGCLFVDIELQPDQPNETDLCGECEICIKFCPTNAIAENRTIRASRCISFLTTNYKGQIPGELCRKIGNNVFGCDICQKVCPLNYRDQKNGFDKEKYFWPIIDSKIDLLSELFFTEEAFLSKYTGTPVAKLSFELFLRNLIIAIGNSGGKGFIDPLTNLFHNHQSTILNDASKRAIASIHQNSQHKD